MNYLDIANNDRTNEIATVIQDQSSELLSFDYNNILQIAERADRMVEALNKIMAAAIKITTPRDWVLIGGNPYLQESGATKVARLFGIGWQILDQHSEYDSDGYPTFTYRMLFTMGGAKIECEGSRSARDEFFAGKRTDRNGNAQRQKSPDAIDIRDVRLAAYTNCLNNGIKRILPGLRNVDISTLENAGMNVHAISGYTFKEGSKGGAKRNNAEESGLVCAECGIAITQKVASYSQGKYGRPLCMSCQDKAKTATVPIYDLPDDEYAPFPSDEDAPPERR